MTKKKLYSFEDHPEHREMLKPWADRWIANAMSTAAMTDDDRAACVEAVNGLYAAAKLPPPKHIVFVPSPFVLRFAGGFAAAIWHMSKTGFQPKGATLIATHSATDDATHSATRTATYGATDDATDDATYDATRTATDDATYDATHSATDSATRDATHSETHSATLIATHSATRSATLSATRTATHSATYDATHSATYDATHSATHSATYDATHSATRSATLSATRTATHSATYDATHSANNYWVFNEDPIQTAQSLGVGEFGIKCAQSAYNMWQGGNQWSGWDSYLSFFQDVTGLDLPEYEHYRHWRTLTERSGPRIMHQDFCMISDRPELLKVDDENRPHSEIGPFCRWRDGSAIYAWHGQFVPAAWLEGNPPTAAEALHWENMDQRAAACEIVGWANILDQLDATVIEDSGHPKWGRLVEVDIPDSGRERFLDAVCGTGRRFALPVPPNTKTVDEAQSVLHGGLPASLLRLAADART